MQIMQQFYQNLLAQQSRQAAIALSLRNAAMEARKTHAEVYYWAPFAVYGGIC